MNNTNKSIILSVLLIIFAVIGVYAKGLKKANENRDPLKWPFAVNSIWNMPIGSKAVYVHAHIEEASSINMDEDYIVLTPNAPLMDIYYSDAGWNRNKSRCEKTGDSLLYSAPIPQNFVVSPQTWDGATPNAGLAVLMPDGRTIKQNQPFAHCMEGGYATTGYTFEDQDIYGAGTYGAHGASGLSAIGGALRVGELTPTSGPIRHVLKVNMFGRKNVYYDEETKGFRWPARAADAYASKSYYKDRKNPVVKECRMGALLALPPAIKIESLGLETEPAKILAKAFQDYGAYLVDDTAYDSYAIMTEWGPDGRFADDFEKNWGFNFNQKTKDSPWGRDIVRIFTNLHVVDNNSPKTIGGGGKLRAPLAPKFNKK